MSSGIVKFTHDHSLFWNESRFWLVGPEVSTSDWYEFHDQLDWVIADAINLDEGRVHLLMTHGSVFEVVSNPHVGFTIQKLRAA